MANQAARVTTPPPRDTATKLVLTANKEARLANSWYWLTDEEITSSPLSVIWPQRFFPRHLIRRHAKGKVEAWRDNPHNWILTHAHLCLALDSSYLISPRNPDDEKQRQQIRPSLSESSGNTPTMRSPQPPRVTAT
ncbi:hypothetical protein O3P69_020611 [Scylla paramamosain]|uniref:Uncharacterized protein n=1 Tax=Scylla paramamosain TaxID=85552 RepID=A0AAW0TMR4_SCYPA